MIETFTALLLAHVLADFAFQSRWMAEHKGKPGAMLGHAAVVLATAVAAVGSASLLLVGLAALHLAIDLAKLGASRTRLGGQRLALFIVDQALHGASLAVIARLAPGLWAGGHLASLPALPPLYALGAGLILATRAGGFAVGLLMDPWTTQAWGGTMAAEGLPNGGRAIGLLERGLIFCLVMTGQAGGIGFLIAAKSVLRFGSVGDDRKISEYVIIGTLASFGWAFATAAGTLVLLAHLPPLGIPDLSH